MNTPMVGSSRCVIVAGMHRSGTSLIAGLLHQGGVDMGAQFLAEGPGNPHGHFEDLEILAFHRRVLRVRGLTPLTVPAGRAVVLTDAERRKARALVARRSRRAPLWGFKDPRALAILDQWDDLLPEAYYILLYRHPIEVALSLGRRGSDPEVLTDPSVAIDAWVGACERTLAFHRSQLARSGRSRCVLWNIGGVSRDLSTYIGALDRRLGLSRPRGGVEMQYLPGELHVGLDCGDWRRAAPDAAALYDELEAAADVPAPPFAPPASSGRQRDPALDDLLACAAMRPRPGDTSPSPEERRSRLATIGRGADAVGLGERLARTLDERLRHRGHQLGALAAKVRNRARPEGSGSPDPRRLLVGCVAEGNPKYLGQALRLVQSLRWFGGRLADARVRVCVVDAVPPDFRAQLERCGAEVLVVSRFDARNPFGNKLQFFELPAPEGVEHILLLDCDTLVVQDPLPLLRRDVVQAKIADLPTVSHDVLDRLYARFGYPLPPRRHRTTFTATRTICYCNSGVLAAPTGLAFQLATSWRDFNLKLLDVIHLLGSSANHVNQAALSLALTATKVPFALAPLALNFPMHLGALRTPREVRTCDPMIVHYHDRVDANGELLQVPYPRAQARAAEFNRRQRLREGARPETADASRGE